MVTCMLGYSRNSRNQNIIICICLATPAIVSHEVVNQIIDEDGSASFTCQATGEPIPNITWYHNGILMDEANTQKYITSMIPLNASIESSIVIMNVKSSDVGTYVCNATNVESTDVSFGVLTVNGELTLSF